MTTLKKLATAARNGAGAMGDVGGCGDLRLVKLGVDEKRVAGLDWTQSPRRSAGASLTQGLKITAWPARHFSGRMP